MALLPKPFICMSQLHFLIFPFDSLLLLGRGRLLEAFFTLPVETERTYQLMSIFQVPDAKVRFRDEKTTSSEKCCWLAQDCAGRKQKSSSNPELSASRVCAVSNLETPTSPVKQAGKIESGYRWHWFMASGRFKWKVWLEVGGEERLSCHEAALRKFSEAQGVWNEKSGAQCFGGLVVRESATLSCHSAQVPSAGSGGAGLAGPWCALPLTSARLGSEGRLSKHQGLQHTSLFQGWKPGLRSAVGRHSTNI